ncbi:MAG TPA: hypothetical protein VF619_11825 [Allosphingosinicella sp.]|jgi:hypothetical protein
MNDQEWRVPAPKDDPEARKALPAREAGVGPRLVPDANIVEGEMEEEDGKGAPACPFS